MCIYIKLFEDPKPSKEDLWIMERLVEIVKLVGIPILAHAIVGHESYTSFVDKGIL